MQIYENATCGCKCFYKGDEKRNSYHIFEENPTDKTVNGSKVMK